MGFDPSTLTNTSTTRWWFQIFLIFTLTWGRFPIWLLFFRWVETTNQTIMSVYHSLLSRPWSLDRFGFTRIHWSPDSQPRERTVFQSPCQRFCCALSRFKFAFFCHLDGMMASDFAYRFDWIEVLNIHNHGKECMELPPDVQSLHFSMSFFDLEGPMHRNSALDFEIITYFKSGLYIFTSRSTMWYLLKLLNSWIWTGEQQHKQSFECLFSHFLLWTQQVSKVLRQY